MYTRRLGTMLQRDPMRIDAAFQNRRYPARYTCCASYELNEEPQPGEPVCTTDERLTKGISPIYSRGHHRRGRSGCVFDAAYKVGVFVRRRFPEGRLKVIQPRRKRFDLLVPFGAVALRGARPLNIGV